MSDVRTVGLVRVLTSGGAAVASAFGVSLHRSEDGFTFAGPAAAHLMGQYRSEHTVEVIVDEDGKATRYTGTPTRGEDGSVTVEVGP